MCSSLGEVGPGVKLSIGGMLMKWHKTNSGHSRARRQREAGERQVLRATRSDGQQLAVLDARLGMGIGARRERRRLGGA